MSRITADRQLDRIKAISRHRHTEKYLPYCEYCGWKLHPSLSKGTDGIEVHHIKPVKHGGDDNADNLISLCPNHHKIVHSLFGDEPALSKQHLLESLATFDKNHEIYFKGQEKTKSMILEAIFDKIYKDIKCWEDICDTIGITMDQYLKVMVYNYMYNECYSSSKGWDNEKIKALTGASKD